MNLPIITVDNTCETGSCNQCGACCTFFSIDGIPSIPGNIHSEHTHKPAGIRCPQLIEGARGQYQCLLHDQKEVHTDILATCIGWSGDDAPPQRKFRTNYEKLLAAMGANILHPASKIHVQELIEYCLHAGLPRNIVEGLQKSLSIEEIFIKFLRHYLITLEILPHEIFEIISLRQIMDNTRDLSSLFDRVGLSLDNSLHVNFIEHYAPSDVVNA